LGRGILIPEALKNGDEDLLASLLEDRWHEPYRLPLIEGAHAIIAYCRIRGIACFLSGAGASLCVLTKRDISLSFEGWETRVYEVSPTGLSYEK
jgi:homoserine kinase